MISVGAGGCGGADELAREAVSGTVTLDDKPLDAGLITFMPEGIATPTQGASPIVDGRYSIPKDQGLVADKYKVIITGKSGPEEKRKDDVPDAPGMPPKIAKETIPAAYNSKSTLTATVEAGGKNEFDFPLLSKPK